MVFRDWALANGYQDDLSIERIDNDGPYSLDNCRWATIQEQNSNTRQSVRVEINGRTQTLKQWAREAGLRYNTISDRYYAGWRGTDLLLPPMKPHARSKRLKEGDSRVPSQS